MRPRFFSKINSSQPFTAALKDGYSPTQIKRGIISLLDPYVFDKKLLAERAIDLFSVDAVSVGRLSTRSDWKSLFDLTFAVRREALLANENEAVAVMTFFQTPIQETQSKFAMQVTFEQIKETMNLDEYAFELFRNIGGIIESTLQPYLKEFYCLICLCKGIPVNPIATLMDDLGKIAADLAKLISAPELIAPAPWRFRLNQWRNIAQHHTYKVVGDRIVAEYGKASPPKRLQLTRDELMEVASEVSTRLAIFKTSRFLCVVNNLELLRPFLANTDEDVSVTCLILSASFATQGFRVVGIDYAEDPVTVRVVDDAPHIGSQRFIHCSQLLLPIASHFPGRAVEVQLRTPDDKPQWAFRLEGEQLDRILSDQDPFDALGHALDWKEALKIARENGMQFPERK